MHRSRPMARTAALLLIVTSACGCSGDPRVIISGDGDMAPIIEGHNGFALDLHRASSEQASGNLFFSPFSITAALSMLYAGAEGETEAQIGEVMGVESESSWHANLGALLQDLSGEHRRPYTLHAANRVWGQKGVDFLSDFTTTLDEQYGAPLENADFAGDAESARQKINKWVSRNTQEYIPELFGSGDITNSTRVALVNAIFFEGSWAAAFDPESTREQTFTLEDGSTVETAMMCQTEKFGLAWEDDLSVLRMPYEGEELSMVVVLPNETDGLSAIEAELDPEQLDGWLDGMVQREIDTCIPRFTMESDLDLKVILEAMGITDAFSISRADLTGMVSREEMDENYHVSSAVHKSFIEVDEQGTTAAAATGFAVADSGSMPEYFHADHPFLFLIRDDLTGAILFMGRLSDPT